VARVPRLPRVVAGIATFPGLALSLWVTRRDPGLAASSAGLQQTVAAVALTVPGWCSSCS